MCASTTVSLTPDTFCMMSIWFWRSNPSVRHAWIVQGNRLAISVVRIPVALRPNPAKCPKMDRLLWRRLDTIGIQHHFVNDRWIFDRWCNCIWTDWHWWWHLFYLCPCRWPFEHSCNDGGECRVWQWRIRAHPVARSRPNDGHDSKWDATIDAAILVLWHPNKIPERDAISRTPNISWTISGCIHVARKWNSDAAAVCELMPGICNS